MRKIIGIGREVMGLKRNGSTFPMDLSVGEAEEDGKPIFVGIIRDLTERRAAEMALREGGERLRAVVETAVDGVILIDSSARVLMFNPAWERLFGYNAAEVIGQNVRMLMPGPFREEHDDYVGNYRRTGAPKVIGIGREVVGLRKDGTTFPMDLSVGEAKQQDESIFVGIIHDLSARKRTEEQLVQAQKMESVGQLSGGIAHDFNNLLTVILGNAEVLSSRLKAREDLRNVAETNAAAAERGAELTHACSHSADGKCFSPPRSIATCSRKTCARCCAACFAKTSTCGSRRRPLPSSPWPTPRNWNPQFSIWRSTPRMRCPMAAC